MTTTTAEEYRAAIKAREAEDQAHRATLQPLRDADLYVTLGRVNRNPSKTDEDLCSRCGRDEALGVIVGISTAASRKAMLCKPCAESTGRYGEALVCLVEAIEEVDNAIFFAAKEDRGAIGGMVYVLVADLLKFRFGPDALDALNAFDTHV